MLWLLQGKKVYEVLKTSVEHKAHEVKVKEQIQRSSACNNPTRIYYPRVNVYSLINPIICIKDFYFPLADKHDIAIPKIHVLRKGRSILKEKLRLTMCAIISSLTINIAQNNFCYF